MKNKIKILFTDLDGTLLNSDGLVSTTNRNCMEDLGRRNIIRVIATGRSFYSYNKVIGKDFPADFLVFSTGAGILDLKTGDLIYAANLEKQDITYISQYLIEHRADFMVHHSVPQNHRFTYFGDTKADSDFTRRLRIYKDYAREYVTPACLPQESAQIIAIFPEDLQRFNSVKKGLNGFQVTRTTSPLDGRSIWMEIYPPHVSKGASAGWLCSCLQIDQQESLGIGNDYNDISLLEFTSKSYVVANAPSEMQQKYRLTLSNNEDGFCQAINNAMLPD
jgi:Cof subfamily protein (haloacid dehalogenase superfamily)